MENLLILDTYQPPITCSHTQNMQSSTYYHQVKSNNMTFSHNPPLYLSCSTMPLGKGLSHTFHRLTSINLTRLTLPAQQRLMVERNPFTLTRQNPMDKRTILALHLSENSYCLITYVHTCISYLKSSCNYIISCHIIIILTMHHHPIMT